jgi:hypothetical protein
MKKRYWVHIVVREHFDTWDIEADSEDGAIEKVVEMIAEGHVDSVESEVVDTSASEQNDDIPF